MLKKNGHWQGCGKIVLCSLEGNWAIYSKGLHNVHVLWSSGSISRNLDPGSIWAASPGHQEAHRGTVSNAGVWIGHSLTVHQEELAKIRLTGAEHKVRWAEGARQLYWSWIKKKKKGIWSVMLNISWTQCSFDSPNDEAKRAGMSRNELLFKSRDRV